MLEEIKTLGKKPTNNILSIQGNHLKLRRSINENFEKPKNQSSPIGNNPPQKLTKSLRGKSNPEEKAHTEPC